MAELKSISKQGLFNPSPAEGQKRIVYTIVPQWRTVFTIIVLVVTNITAMSLPHKATEARAGCVILATAILWVTEGMPLMITALLPAVMFPLAGVLDSHTVCAKYFNYISMLMLGSFLMAEGIESCGLHRRIALKILSILGLGESLLMMGAMFTTWLLSMFMSNTATTAMMLPIVGAIINSLREINSVEERRIAMTTMNGPDNEPEAEDIDPEGAEIDSPEFKWFCKGLLLSIPYGASIGGIATLTGTPPNLVLKAAFEKDFPDAPPIDYGKWLSFAFPLSALLVCVGWSLLATIYTRKSLWSLIRMRPFLDKLGLDEETKKWRHINKQIRQKYKELGTFRFPEVIMLLLSVILVLLWLTRDPEGITGWGKVHAKQFDMVDGKHIKYLDDAWVVVLLSLALFIIPQANPLKGEVIFKAAPGTKVKRIPRLLDMDTVMKKTPWDVLFILGGGYAIAEGCTKSNLANWLGEQFSFLDNSPHVIIAIVISCLVAFLTEFASNTASTNLLMPILSSMSLKIHVHPLYLMITGTISASLAFCLPSATGPNALVFSFKEITVLDMFRTGFAMNCICVLITVMATSTWITAIMGLDTFPDWANSTLTP